MKRWFSFLLLFGAILGLLAQEAAFAIAPAIPMSSDTRIAASVMSDECADMMGIDKSEDSEPCKGLTLDCIAKMGCTLPLAFVTPANLLAAAVYRANPVGQLAVTRLMGRNFGPEPEPPLFRD